MGEESSVTGVELAWAAGLFEGEGSIRVNKPTGRNLGHLVCSVANTDIEVVRFFQARWPGHFKIRRPLPNRRPAWEWLISTQRAAAFLRIIRPFVMTDRVKRKIEVALAFQEQKCRTPCGRRSWPAEYVARQWGFYETMRGLNRRGTQATPPKTAVVRERWERNCA